MNILYNCVNPEGVITHTLVTAFELMQHWLRRCAIKFQCAQPSNWSVDSSLKTSVDL